MAKAAKKAGKTAKKKRPGKKVTPSANTPAVATAALTAAEIVAEIVAEMEAVIATLYKTFTSTALSEWRPELHDAVDRRLQQGGDWPRDRAKVLAVAGDMTRIAAILSAGSPTVAKARVHAAFRAAKDHATCPVDAGSGKWCDFNI